MWFDLLVEVIQILPSLLLSVGAVIAILFLIKPICKGLIPRLSGLKYKGMELMFLKKAMEDALELAEKNERWRHKIKITNKDKETVLNRARKHQDITRDTNILWIDDVPMNNKNEERMLWQLGIKVDYALNTEEAIRLLKADKYDLILSDIARQAKDGKLVGDAGIQTLQKLREKDFSLPFIFYIGDYDPALGCPEYAFGITDRPDELLHLILDVLERKKL